MTHNGFLLVPAWAFEAASCPIQPNEVEKTNLQNNTSPQARISTMCAPAWAKVSKDAELFQRV